MQTNLRGRDVITLDEFTKEELETLLDVAFQLKRERALGIPHPLLRDKTLAMLFFFSSTRTRGSFESGMAQLGGHPEFIEAKSTQIAHGDTAKEIGEILGRYNDGIAIRQVDWQVGNGYIRATVSWAYAASYQKPISVPQSLVTLLPRFGMNVRLVHPPEFKLMPEIMDLAQENARAARVGFEVLDDFEEGMRDTNVVYAKSWGALMTTEDEKEGAAIIDKYKDWIADEPRLKLADQDAIYMHPLPADRGVEVADAVIDGPHSVVYDQAENRLHGQKAVMALTM